MPTAADIAEFLGAPLHGTGPGPSGWVRDIVDDSRSVCPGDAYLALPGAHWHGLDFEDEVVAAGASLVISDRPARRLPTVVVDHPRARAGALTSWFHGHPSRDMHVLGVTGTNGKSSSAAMIHAGLLGADATAGLISGVEISAPGVTLTPTRTTPEAAVIHRTLATFRHAGCRAVAMEVSSHAAVHHRVDGVHFRVMALTNLSPEHLDFHGSMEAYYRAKTSLFEPDRTDIAVASVDDAYGRRLAASARIPVWTCSTSDRPALGRPGAGSQADVVATDVVAPAAGSTDDLGHRFTVHTPAGSAPIELQVLGPHQVANAVIATAVLVADGVDLAAVAEGISALRTIPGRCEPVHAGQSFTALVDYMHNVAGQQSTLPFLRTRTPGRLVLVVGATGDRDPAKRAPLGRTAASFADVVIVTDESPGSEDPAVIRAEVIAGAVSARAAAVIEVPDRDAALRLAITGAIAGDTVVVSGRGSDRRQQFGNRVVHFDDRARLAAAITEGARGLSAADSA